MEVGRELQSQGINELTNGLVRFVLFKAKSPINVIHHFWITSMNQGNVWRSISTDVRCIRDRSEFGLEKCEKLSRRKITSNLLLHHMRATKALTLKKDNIIYIIISIETG